MKEDNLMEEHEYWVNKYREHFKKIYPLMEFRGSSYKENIKRIKKAIKENVLINKIQIPFNRFIFLIFILKFV